MTYCKPLDSLRTFAVFAVLISHWLDNRFFVLFPWGSSGVNLFFVLSGYLITSGLIENKLSIENGKLSFGNYFKQFFLKRSLRIFPIYYLTIAIGFIVGFPPIKEIIFWLLTYSSNIYFFSGGNLKYFAHFWSLAVEEQFYLVFPLLLYVVPRKRFFYLFLSIIAFGLFSRYWIITNTLPRISSFTLLPCTFDAFGLGGLLAYLKRFNNDLLKAILSKIWILILIILAFVGYVMYYKMHFLVIEDQKVILNRFLFSLISVWIIGLCVHDNIHFLLRPILYNPMIMYLGKISYGIYVYHNFMHPVFRDGFGIVISNQYLRFVIYFLATLLISHLSWIYFEKYFLKIKERFTLK